MGCKNEKFACVSVEVAYAARRSRYGQHKGDEVKVQELFDFGYRWGEPLYNRGRFILYISCMINDIVCLFYACRNLGNVVCSPEVEAIDSKGP